MDEIKLNAIEFLESGKDNIKKHRWNASVSDFFKSIVTFSDYLLYNEFKILPKNHNERFQLLEKYYPDIKEKITGLFEIYRDSYNLRMKKEDALKMEEYEDEIGRIIQN